MTRERSVGNAKWRIILVQLVNPVGTEANATIFQMISTIVNVAGVLMAAAVNSIIDLVRKILV